MVAFALTMLQYLFAVLLNQLRVSLETCMEDFFTAK